MSKHPAHRVIQALNEFPNAQERLPAREYFVLRLRAEGKTQGEIGELIRQHGGYTLTRARVGQIERQALSRLRAGRLRGTPEAMYRWGRWGDF